MATDIGFIAIADEVLSGRTEEKNVKILVDILNSAGLNLAEVRIISDDEVTIARHVNELRSDCSWVFTSGGIGPTHDDRTVDGVALAFGVEVQFHPEALELLEAYYGAEYFSASRRRMARTPRGAGLIENPISIAPGFCIGNVVVAAGVPQIFREMVAGFVKRIEGGRPETRVTIDAGGVAESQYAERLRAVQDDCPHLRISSYPLFLRPDKRIDRYTVRNEIVVRGAEPEDVENAVQLIRQELNLLLRSGEKTKMRGCS